MTPVLGATWRGEGRCEFLAWAPRAPRVELHLLGRGGRLVAMQPQPHGYHYLAAEGVEPGATYSYRLGGVDRPDPASRFQPEGVHGPSQVIDPRFDWGDAAWRGVPLADYVLYELHVGTFTPEGTFDAIVPRLDELQELGVSAIELMPVAQFPGGRNWGYDGVHPYAVQNTYGGPAGLKRLINACHTRGLAVVLDVVYNHLGPEGNYLSEFAPYFTDRYRTPWGEAINYDGAGSDEVRRYFIENALFWVTEYHVDALRLDAIHAIVDPSARPILGELGKAVHARANELGRRIHIMPESDRNDASIVASPERGGQGLDAVWNDDFHHALHALLTRERNGYYQDFGSVEHLAKAFSEGFVYSGQYSAYRGRRQGNSSRELPADRFVVFAQNHDQVGNRMGGERLSALTSFGGLKLAAAAVVFSPFTPLLFMGEEYGETAPFLYFTSHYDPGLIEAVRRGRRAEFSAFGWQSELPDPQSETTFERSRLNWDLRREKHHGTLRRWYQELIAWRRKLAAPARTGKEHLQTDCREAAKVLLVRRGVGANEAAGLFHFGEEPVRTSLPLPAGRWRKRLDSAEPRWQGNGRTLPAEVDSRGEAAMELGAFSFALFTREESSPH